MSTTTLLLRTYPNYVFPVVILVFDRPLGETTWSLEHTDAWPGSGLPTCISTSVVSKFSHISSSQICPFISLPVFPLFFYRMAATDVGLHFLWFFFFITKYTCKPFNCLSRVVLSFLWPHSLYSCLCTFSLSVEFPWTTNFCKHQSFSAFD